MAAIDFPNSPTNGQIFSSGGKSWKYNSAKGVWQSVVSETSKNLSALDQSIVPSANVTYDLGSSTNAFRDLYLSGNTINLGGQTITADESGIILPEGSKVGNISLGTGGATQYANTSQLPKQNLTAGQFSFIGNTLYMTNGSGWYSVALINQTPSLSISTNEIVLGGTGNTINFTFTATDPDGPAPTVTAALIGANTSQANVVVYSANSTVTVENLSAEGYSANIVLTATDGIDQTFGTVVLQVSFLPDWTATTEQQKVLADDAQASDNFGHSIDIDGDTMIVGAPLEDALGSSAGAAYIFTRSGTTWTQQAKLVASDGVSSDQFGISVAISGDTVIVGAWLESVRPPGGFTGNTQNGAVYIFTRSGTTWTQQQKIQASDNATADNFGRSVAIDGDTAIVGSPGDDSNGSAYIYTRSGTSWSQQQKITGTGLTSEAEFGYSVAVDGDTAIVGAWKARVTGTFPSGTDPYRAGIVFVFTRSGTTWTQLHSMNASDAAQDVNLGTSVSVSGNTVVAGAPLESSGGTFAGAAYLFTFDAGSWSQQQKILASDAEAQDRFGFSVSVDGNVVIVGAYSEDTGAVDSGAAYIFTKDGSTWTEQAKIQASDALGGDLFGYSVSVSEETETVVVGSRNEDEGGDSAGSAYIFVSG